MKRNLLDKVEARLGELLEKPVNSAAPLDPKVLKEKMARRLQETGDAYLPERWYVLLPAALQARDAEVRAWVKTVWEQFLGELDHRDWPAGAAPTMAVRYDADLPEHEVMVGIDPHSVRPRGRAPAAPRSRAANAMMAAKVVLLVAAVGIVLAAFANPGAFAWRPTLPGLPAIQGPSLPAVQGPSLPSVRLPAFGVGSTRYVATAEVRVRSEPTTKAAQVGTMPAGQMVMVSDAAIVQGEAIDGEDRWADISGLQGWLGWGHRFIWLGALKPAP